MFDVFLFPTKSLAGIFWASLLLFIIPFIIRSKKRTLFIVLFLLAIILSVLLVLSNSRSGWLGCASALTYIAYQHIYIRRKKVIILTAALFLLLFFLTLLFYKPGSSSGRKHIYSISAEMLRDNWIHGIGLGKFKASFNEYQADYFTSNNIDNKRALLADNTFYAFNDYLQWIIETGIAGVVAMFIVIYFLFKRIRIVHKRNGSKTIIVAATSCLLCISIAALFSYPLQIVPIQAISLFCMGIIIFYPLSEKNTAKINSLIGMTAKVIFLILTILFAINSVRTLQRKAGVEEAFELAITGYKKQAIDKYESLIEKFPKHGDIMYLYAEQLYYSNRLSEALSAINKARNYYVDNKVYNLKARIEDELGIKNEAETSYQYALYMVPNRMGSRFDLLNFYLTQKDTVNAVHWAKSIINMSVKVPSEKTERMLIETQKIFQQIGN